MKTHPLRTRRKVSITFGESMTEQHHKDRCSMSNILNKYRKTGLVTHNAATVGHYADYPTELEFHLMQNRIAAAKSMFESIPSHIRALFDNDPGTFLSYAQDPDNRDDLIEMGFSADHLPPAAGPAQEAAKETAAKVSEDPPAPSHAKEEEK